MTGREALGEAARILREAPEWDEAAGWCHALSRGISERLFGLSLLVLGGQDQGLKVRKMSQGRPSRGR